LYNIHFSLLPEYKGVYTSLLPILHGRNKTGVTLHKIDSGIDTGGIIDQREIKINDDTSCRSLYFQLMNAGIELIKNNFNYLASNTVSIRIQGSKGSTYYSRKCLDFNLKEINPFQTAFQIQRNVNAFIFREYQMPIYNGKEIKRVEITDRRSNFKPGTIIYNDNEKIEIATIDFNVVFFQDYYRNLVNCARINDVIQLEKIIGYIDDINEIEENGWTPLMIACFNGSADVVKVLIEHGADVNGTNLNGTSPIMYAKEYTLSKGDFSCLKLLLENGATLNTLDIYNRTVFDYLDKVENAELYNYLANHNYYD